MNSGKPPLVDTIAGNSFASEREQRVRAVAANDLRCSSAPSIASDVEDASLLQLDEEQRRVFVLSFDRQRQHHFMVVVARARCARCED